VRRLGAGLLAGLVAAALVPAARAEAADPTPRTPIRHFISLMLENHSFDNYFGTYPGADGIPQSVCMPVRLDTPGSRCIKPFHIENEAVEDLNHSPEIARNQLDGGRMDGFVAAIARERGRVQPLVMGHYDDRDIPFSWNVADDYVLFDRFFTSALGGSVLNHMYWVSGGPGAQRGDFIPPEGFDDPTIFDRLQAKGISWKFYVQDYDPAINVRSRALGDRGSQLVRVPLLDYPRVLDDRRLLSHIVPFQQLFEDLRRGQLPAVSYVVPSATSEHTPGSTYLGGETFVRTIVNGLMRSSAWKSSAFMWSYDDWGGWYDHVRPPAVDGMGYGFRAPALLVSPYAKRGYIDHRTLDFTSMLKFIEQNWDLAPLASRDRAASGLMSAFDFSRGPREPVLLSRRRGHAPLPEPKRTAVYVSYSAAVGVAALVIAAALLLDTRVRRRRGPLDGPSRRIRLAAGERER
jgi:phospholipase C